MIYKLDGDISSEDIGEIFNIIANEEFSIHDLATKYKVSVADIQLLIRIYEQEVKSAQVEAEYDV